MSKSLKSISPVTFETVEAARTALFARQGKGEKVSEAEWDVVAAAQRVLDDETFDARGMFRTRTF